MIWKEILVLKIIDHWIIGYYDGCVNTVTTMYSFKTTKHPTVTYLSDGPVNAEDTYRV